MNASADAVPNLLVQNLTNVRKLASKTTTVSATPAAHLAGAVPKMSVKGARKLEICVRMTTNALATTVSKMI